MEDLKESGEFQLKKEELENLKKSFCSESLTENETQQTINETYKKKGILIDPHTAVAVGVVKKVAMDTKTVILATAHPSKFSDVVKKTTNIEPELPENLKDVLFKKEQYKKLPKDLKKVKNYILEKI